MTKAPKNYKTVMGYASGIIAGEIIANEDRMLACERFLKDLQNPAYDFRANDAEFVIGIIESTLVHVKGPLKGKPFLLLPWEKFVIYNVAGFYLAGTSERRFKEAFIFIPRKNGKTPFAAALAWGMGLLERKYGSTVYLVGNVLKQALESFTVLLKNIQSMGEAKAYTIHESQNDHSIKRVWRDAKNVETAFLDIVALASNPDSQDSFNCNFAICDEMHAYTKTKQYTLFKQAMKAYINKLLIGITTAGDRSNSFCYKRLQYCKKVLRGVFQDEQYFIWICQADNPDDYTNPIEHEKANPSYGVIIRPEEILQTSIQAQNDPEVRADFLSKELNVYVNNVKTYFDMDVVSESDEKYSWTLEELAKLPITWYGGADLSKMFDLTGTALHGRYGDVQICIAHGFMPVAQATIKADSDNIPFFEWKEEKWLTLCNSEVINYAEVADWFVAMRKMGFKIKEVGYDRRYSREFVKIMKLNGFRCADQAQRYVEKTEPFREIEKGFKAQKFYYLHNRAYEYCIGNVHAIEDSDEFVRFEKVEPTQRIDLFDADVIACKRMMIGEEKSNKAKKWFNEEEDGE